MAQVPEWIMGYYYLHHCGDVIWSCAAKVEMNGGEAAYFDQSPGSFVVDYIAIPKKRPEEGPTKFYENLEKRFMEKTLRPEITKQALEKVKAKMIAAE